MKNFPLVINVTELGKNGFKIGISDPDKSLLLNMNKVNGDFNGDGFDDLIVLEIDELGNVRRLSIVLGKNNSDPVNFDNLSSDQIIKIILPDGFNIKSQYPYAFWGVGDVNDDNKGDFVVVSQSPDFKGRFWGVVVFGRKGNQAIILSDLGGQGFYFYSNRSYVRTVKPAGDMNGDGKGDISLDFDPPVIVYGKSDNQTVCLDKLTTDGFSIDKMDIEGGVYSTIGDFNKDGFGDIILVYSGNVFKRTNFRVILGGSNNTKGNLFIGGGQERYYFPLNSNFAGDINRDGYDDILVKFSNGPVLVDSNTTIIAVIFGRRGRSNITDINQAGFVVRGKYLWSNVAVSGIGDINHDGYDDFIIGCLFMPDGRKVAAYIIFGKKDNGIVDLDHLDASQGIIIVGLTEIGGHVSGVGDVNGDGKDDFAIVDGSEQNIYVIFCNLDNFQATLTPSVFPSSTPWLTSTSSLTLTPTPLEPALTPTQTVSLSYGAKSSSSYRSIFSSEGLSFDLIVSLSSLAVFALLSLAMCYRRHRNSPNSSISAGQSNKESRVPNCKTSLRRAGPSTFFKPNGNQLETNQPPTNTTAIPRVPASIVAKQGLSCNII